MMSFIYVANNKLILAKFKMTIYNAIH